MKYQAKSSIVIDAPLEKVRAYVEDFNTWRSWSPWSVIEPEHQGSVEGEAGQVGHKMSWDGEVIGAGINTITSREGDSILYNLEFLKPFKSKATTRFDFETVDGGTKVTWIMNGKLPFFCFFMINKMKSWIEMDYQRGLIMLKSMIEEGEVDADTTNEGVAPFEGFGYVGIKMTSTMENMPKDMEACFMELVGWLQEQGKMPKHWITLYPKVDMAKKIFTCIAACSDESLEGLELPKHYVRGQIKSGSMFQVKHRGSYLYLGNAWSMGMMTTRAKKMKMRDIPFEYYWNNPNNTEPKDLQTSIYFPIKD